jgi:hypothetical protein
MIPSSSSYPSHTSHPRSDSTPRNAENTLSSKSNIRPRNRRLISTEQELVSTSGSRAVSPIPQKHPSRSVSRSGYGESTVLGASGRTSPRNGRPVAGLLAPPEQGKGGRSSPVGIGDIWEGGWQSSWSALQGFASSVLGGLEAEREGLGSAASQGKKPRRTGLGMGKGSATWGPEALPKRNDGGIGMGSTAERDAGVRAKKMARLLEGREEPSKLLDTNGNYKHRASLDEQRPGSSQDDGGDALVYIHHVQPQDTLAGVVLKYNCQPAVFKKANRFWPNDSIQIRKVVVLPVDACAIKGRPCDPPSPDSPGVDLLAPTPAIEDLPPFSNGGTWPGASSSQKQTSAERPEEDENPWTHVRWVLLDSSPNSKPVEVARMPRKTLGYFPPRRRKSILTASSVSTPRASSEFPRVSQSALQSCNDHVNGSATGTPPRRTSNLGPRPSQPITSYFPPPPMTSSTRPRRESVGEAADRLGWMRGPGGVGTLGKNVRMPGPGKDSLNTWTARHLPGIAIDSLPSTSILGAETAHFGFSGGGEELGRIAEGPFNGGNASGTVTPSGTGQGGLGIENAAAKIEGWVRRLAVKRPGTPLGGGRQENVDLIELLDGAGSDDGRGFELSPGRLRSSTPSGSGREYLDGLIRGGATAGIKGGKSD